MNFGESKNSLIIIDFLQFVFLAVVYMIVTFSIAEKSFKKSSLFSNQSDEGSDNFLADIIVFVRYLTSKRFAI